MATEELDLHALVEQHLHGDLNPDVRAAVFADASLLRDWRQAVIGVKQDVEGFLSKLKADSALKQQECMASGTKDEWFRYKAAQSLRLTKTSRFLSRVVRELGEVNVALKHHAERYQVSVPSRDELLERWKRLSILRGQALAFLGRVSVDEGLPDEDIMTIRVRAGDIRLAHAALQAARD